MPPKRAAAFRLRPDHRNELPNRPERMGRFLRHSSGVQWCVAQSTIRWERSDVILVESLGLWFKLPLPGETELGSAGEQPDKG